MAASTWKEVGGQLAQMGLPILGRALGGAFLGGLGGTIGENVGQVMAVVVAKALGVSPTPAAVSQAIEEGNTTEVVASLRAAEAEAAVRWPSLADIEGHERRAEVEVARINAEASAEMRRAIGTNGPIQSFYRVILLWGATAGLLLFSFLFFMALIADDNMWQKMVDGYFVISWFVGIMGTIVGFHFFSRASERRAAIQAPVVESSR